MAKIGILFDIDELGGGLYGFKAYKIFFDIIEPDDIAGFIFYDGDIINGKNEYCIALESDNTYKLAKISNKVLAANTMGLSPANERILDEVQVNRQPLVPAMRMGLNGEVIGCDTPWILEAWDKAKAGKKVEVSEIVKPTPSKKPVIQIESFKLIEPPSTLSQRRKIIWISAVALLPVSLFLGTIFLTYIFDSLLPGDTEIMTNYALVLSVILAVLISFLLLFNGYRKNELLIDKDSITRKTYYWGNRKREWFLRWDQVIGIELVGVYIRIASHRDVKLINHKNYEGCEGYPEFKRYFGEMVNVFMQKELRE